MSCRGESEVIARGRRRGGKEMVYKDDVRNLW